MNGYPSERELPELTDDQIQLLDSICKSASGTAEGPFKALFHQYDRLSHEHDLDTSRDNAVYRWMLRVGEKARRDQRIGRSIDFVPYLRSILAAHGITVVDDEENEDKEVAIHSSDIPNGPARSHDAQLNRRRVSFDDARWEETWLSERSQFEQPQPSNRRNSMLKRPPRRPGEAPFTQRARSVSSERYMGARPPAPKHFQNASPSSGHTSEYGEQRNPTLFFQPSLTQLGQNAEAFYATSELRSARYYLHFWHDRALTRQAQDVQASTIDRLRLLREAFGELRSKFLGAQRERELETLLPDYHRRRDFLLLDRSFSHWHGSAIYQIRANEHSRKQLLRKRYFTRWRNLAAENTIKARSILSRKYLKVWRERTLRRALVHEQADAHYEETLERKCIRRWLWVRRESLVEGRHDVWLQRNALGSWLSKLHQRRTQEDEADNWRSQRLARFAFRALVTQLEQHQQSSAAAHTHYSNKLTSQCLQTLRIRTTLAPIANALSEKVNTALKRKALQVWKLQLSLNQQAAEVDRKRILQSAWTAWNDRLRCKALAQRIDERLMVENLRKWVLRYRAEAFRRAQNDRLLQRTFLTWKNSVQDREQRLQQALTEYAEGQRWRRLKFGMLRLNTGMRNREDAERAAVEFSNSKMLPDILAVWKQRTEHTRQLAKWAADARFYCLTTRTLKVWRERTTEHQNQRRRDAYAQVRAMVKARIVRHCFARLKYQSAKLADLKRNAENIAQNRLFKIGTAAFDTWRDKTNHYIELETQAVAVDRGKLLSSALSAMVAHQQDFGALEQQALLFRQESDFALLASALKKMQWVTFTAARRLESAEALWKRNQDQHMKYLLRYWASQATKKKSSKGTLESQDPESPSIRPASRAASKSAERQGFASSPPVRSNTPAYMRTPSRSRRAGRFRPLPTPAHVTPMAFNRGFFVTTPAPLAPAQAGDAGGDSGEASGIFEGLTPQITPFARKLRASGVTPLPPSALRSSVLGRSMAGTNKSVRFAGSSRFGSGRRTLDTTDE